MKKNILLILLFSILFIAPVSVLLYSEEWGTLTTFRNYWNYDCKSTPVPAGYKLLYNEQTKRWATARPDNKYGGIYLWAIHEYITFGYTASNETFGDSCKAKAFILQRVRQEEESQINNNFNP